MEKFGRLTIINTYFKWVVKRNYKFCLCICDCGKIKEIRRDGLVSGNVVSCGCYNKEKSSERFTKHGHCKNYRRSREYNTWCDMLDRCYNLDGSNYKNYGGRGIKVCDRWLESFENFLEDMGPKPGPEYSIERIDNDGNYCKENCKWATMKEQSRNKSSTHYLTYLEIRLCIADWSIKTGISSRAIHGRLKRGWSIDKTLTTPSLRKGKNK